MYKNKSNMSNFPPLFINKSNLPINLETWQIDDGFAERKTITVKKDDNAILGSITGEWTLHTYNITEPSMKAEWKAAGYETGEEIGKFVNKCWANGSYSCMCNEDFQIVYDKEKNTATFSKK